MNKKPIILIILSLLFITGALFWWSQSEEELEGYFTESEGIEFPKKREFIIQDTSEGKIIENKRAGIKAKVPDGWNAEIVNFGWDYSTGEPTDEWIVNLSTADAEFEPNNLLTKGCAIGITVEYGKENFEFLNQFVQGAEYDPKAFQTYREKYKMELWEISGYTAWKEVLIDDPKFGMSIDVKIPVDNKVYAIDTFLNPKDKERCSQEFNKFLKTISIE